MCVWINQSLKVDAVKTFSPHPYASQEIVSSRRDHRVVGAGERLVTENKQNGGTGAGWGGAATLSPTERTLKSGLLAHTELGQ